MQTNSEGIKRRLANEISKHLAGMTRCQAETRTGISSAEIARIHNNTLRKFTIDRLITILESLEPDAILLLCLFRK